MMPMARTTLSCIFLAVPAGWRPCTTSLRGCHTSTFPPVTSTSPWLWEADTTWVWVLAQTTGVPWRAKSGPIPSGPLPKFIRIAREAPAHLLAEIDELPPAVRSSGAPTRLLDAVARRSVDIV